MATNPLWRKSLSEWKHQTLRWFQKRSMFQVPLSDVFFDFDTAYGVLSFGRELRDHIMRFVQRERVLFHAMLQTEADRRVALGLLGRLHSERTQEGILKINLKHGGILPLAGAVRLLALKEGLKATSTHKRIGLLHEAGVFSDDEADEYLAALEHLATILLRQQLRDFKRFQKATPYVRKSEISRREKHILRMSLKAIRSLQDRVRMEFTAEVF